MTEQAFSLPGDLAYQRHGLIFGARLAAAATRLEVTDAVFARNLRGFARQCVFHALLLGHVTADDLRESTDVWSLVTAAGSPSAGASPARMFEFATRGPPSGTGATTFGREIVTCAAGAARLDAQWTAEIARAGTIFGRRLFPDAATDALARAELMAALPAAHDFLIGASRSAGEIMRQQMVLNAVHDAGEQWAAEAGNAAALRAYTEARAEAQTVSAYRAIGRQAETWVPLLRIVFECLYIGAFPMAVLLMLTPAGTAIFRSYVTGLIWLQSWGPLYAVLHRISMGEAAERMAASASMPGGEAGISLIAQAGIRAVASDVAVMSGYLSMSVPFLAAALAYGLSKATVLATSVLAVGQDAASAAAHEGTTGNLSLANTSAYTHRYATLEGRQIRTSAHVDADRYTGYAPGGAGVTVAGDGTVIADVGAATSRIPAAGVRLSESLATSHETRAAEARGLSRQWSAEAGHPPRFGLDRLEVVKSALADQALGFGAAVDQVDRAAGADYQGLNLYGSYDPRSEKDRGMHRWATGVVARFPGVGVSIVPRPKKRSPPKCPHCYEEVAVCPSCGSDMRGTEEKGVDVRIATDMISLAWAGTYDVGVLVSSDRDFVPLAEFLATKGLKVIHGRFPPQGAELAGKCWGEIGIPGLREDFRLERGGK